MKKIVLLIIVFLGILWGYSKVSQACSPAFRPIVYPARGANLESVPTNGLFLFDSMFLDEGIVQLLKNDGEEIPLVVTESTISDFVTDYIDEEFYKTEAVLEPNTDYTVRIVYDDGRRDDSRSSTVHFTTSEGRDDQAPQMEGIQEVQIEYFEDNETVLTYGCFSDEELSRQEAIARGDQNPRVLPEHYNMTIKLKPMNDASGVVYVSLYKKEGNTKNHIKTTKIYTPSSYSVFHRIKESELEEHSVYQIEIQDIYGNKLPKIYSARLTLNGDQSTYQLAIDDEPVGPKPPPPPPEPEEDSVSADGCSLSKQSSGSVNVFCELFLLMGILLGFVTVRRGVC